MKYNYVSLSFKDGTHANVICDADRMPFKKSVHWPESVIKAHEDIRLYYRPDWFTAPKPEIVGLQS